MTREVIGRLIDDTGTAYGIPAIGGKPRVVNTDIAIRANTTGGGGVVSAGFELWYE